MIDHSFTHRADVSVLEGYIKSGVTIGIDFDIGRYRPAEIEHMCSTELAEKLMPYAGLIGQDAIDFLATNPLTITEAEAQELTSWIDASVLNRLADSWNHSAANISFYELLGEQQTVLASLVHEYKHLATYTKNLWRFAADGDWSAVIEKLRNFNDDNPIKRNEEADLLEITTRNIF